jgi:hypothetical protein
VAAETAAAADIIPLDQSDAAIPDAAAEPIALNQSEAPIPPRRSGRARKAKIWTKTTTTPPPNADFTASRQKELNDLISQGVFDVVDDVNDIPVNIRIFGSRFVDEVKHVGTEKAFEKSRLVVQGYNDQGKQGILTQAPTIQRSSQRILLCVLTTKKGVSACVRDISQAYTQSTTALQREIFIKAPIEAGLSPGAILRVNKPLYGIPEAGNHWFSTYQTHHTTKLGLTTSTYDPCLLYRENAVVGLQTDDSLIVSTKEFLELEETEIKRAGFRHKPLEHLEIGRPMGFNGFMTELFTDGSVVVTQDKQTAGIRLLDQHFTKDQYVAQRARGAYIATVSQPETAFALSFAAQITEPTWDDAQFLNRCLQHQKSAPGMRFVRLDEASLRLIAFTDSSFANNRDHSSQIGYVIVLVDKDDNANVIHWQSVKCRRVTRSVLASELYAMGLGFDIAATIRSTLNQLFPRRRQEKGISGIPLSLCVDSKSLYDCLTKLGTTQEKRLMIDIMCLRQAYERREITEILWIQGEKNPADGMTKEKPCDALKRLISTNKLDLGQVSGWVDRGEQQI